MNRDT